MSDVYKLYDGTVTLEFNETSHRYKVNGEYKQGVTSVLQVLSKDSLIQWAANMACDWLRSNAVRQHDGWFVSEDDLKMAKYAHLRKRDSSADSGKLAHEWIEHHIKGEDTPRPFDMNANRSIDHFLKWEAEHRPKYLFSEKLLYSKQYDYCGTADVAFEMNGKRYLGDFKTGNPDSEYQPRLKRYTGKKRAYATHLMQVGAYDQAYQEEHKQPFDAYMVLYISKDGDLNYFEHTNTDQLKEAFLTVLKTQRLKKMLDTANTYQ